MYLKRRIVREGWYWPTVRKIAEGLFRSPQSKTDLLLELDIRARSCCSYFGKDPIACRECFNFNRKETPCLR